MEQIINPAKDAGMGSADVWSVYVMTTDSLDVTIDLIELLILTIESIDSYAGPKPHLTFEIEANTLQPSGNYRNEIMFIVKPVF